MISGSILSVDVLLFLIDLDVVSDDFELSGCCFCLLYSCFRLLVSSCFYFCVCVLSVASLIFSFSLFELQNSVLLFFVEVSL